jgi:hypothetical protein
LDSGPPATGPPSGPTTNGHDVHGAAGAATGEPGALPGTGTGYVVELDDPSMN